MNGWHWLRVVVLLALGVGPVAAGPEMDGASGPKLAALLAMPKVDAHAHLMRFPAGEEARFIGFLERMNFKWLDICTFILDGEEDLGEQHRLARHFHSRYPERLGWAVSFPLDRWGEPGWCDSSLAWVEAGFRDGAVAVKLWKDLGMTLRDPDSGFVMVDDPRLGPVLELIRARGKSLVAHIGEPRNCWLPLEEMTTAGDRGYFREFPQYHGYLLPRVPGYARQVAARDNLLTAHPALRTVGCHLGSLEYDVDSLAARLERYPQFAVDLAGRVVHLQLQDRDKVRAFVLKYQDRLLYGTDNLVDDKRSLEQQLEHFEQVYRLDCRYFATADELAIEEVHPGFSCRGLDLPMEALRLIFHDNAARWYPGL